MTSEELQALIARNAEAITSLRDTAEVQLRTIESQRENIGSNAQMMADAMEMAAIAQQMAAKSQETASQSQETAAIALRMSAETTRNIDRLEQMVEIIIRDNQADRTRISRMEGQD
jgi:hypothetical protein